MALERDADDRPGEDVLRHLPLSVVANIGIQSQQHSDLIIGIHIPRHQVERQDSFS